MCCTPGLVRGFGLKVCTSGLSGRRPRLMRNRRHGSQTLVAAKGLEPTRPNISLDPTRPNISLDPTRTNISLDPTRTNISLEPTRTNNVLGHAIHPCLYTTMDAPRRIVETEPYHPPETRSLSLSQIYKFLLYIIRLIHVTTICPSMRTLLV